MGGVLREVLFGLFVRDLMALRQIPILQRRHDQDLQIREEELPPVSSLTHLAPLHQVKNGAYSGLPRPSGSFASLAAAGPGKLDRRKKPASRPARDQEPAVEAPRGWGVKIRWDLHLPDVDHSGRLCRPSQTLRHGKPHRPRSLQSQPAGEAAPAQEV